MKTDIYTKFIMTIIALCLVVLAWETVDKAMAPEAQAQVGRGMPTNPPQGISVVGQRYVYCKGANGMRSSCLAVKIFN
jgi:hypothetical protein